MKKSTILIVGPGAMGCFWTARLSLAGFRTVLLDHRPERARRIAAHGLWLEKGSGRSERIETDVISDASAAGGVDGLLVCVKAYDTESAIRFARPAIGSKTVVISLQNGLGNGEVLQRYVDNSRIVLGVTGQGATMLGERHVRHAGEGMTRLAPLKAAYGTRAAERAAAWLDSAGVSVRIENDPLPMLWSKLVVNAAINPVSALWDMKNGALPACPEAWRVVVAAAREAETVARGKGVKLLFADAEAEVAQVCSATAENVSSMLQDVRRGRRTEIDAINGAVVREASQLAIDVPVNQHLLRKIVQ